MRTPTFPRFRLGSAALGLGILFAAIAPGRADQLQGWYQSTIWKRLNDQWSVGNYAEARVNDGLGDLHTWIVSPRVRYDLHPRLQLQLNTTWVEALNGPQTRSVDSFRLEFEANPNVKLSESVEYSMRNRFEWRRLDNGDAFNTRIRMRPQFDWVMARSGVFRGLYANNEVFYDFTQGRITENRLIPLGAVFRPSPELELRVFHLWRKTLAGTQWFDHQALGVLATYTF